MLLDFAALLELARERLAFEARVGGFKLGGFALPWTVEDRLIVILWQDSRQPWFLERGAPDLRQVGDPRVDPIVVPPLDPARLLAGERLSVVRTLEAVALAVRFELALAFHYHARSGHDSGRRVRPTWFRGKVFGGLDLVKGEPRTFSAEGVRGLTRWEPGQVLPTWDPELRDYGVGP